jgi:hypothetical protein
MSAQGPWLCCKDLQGSIDDRWLLRLLVLESNLLEMQFCHIIYLLYQRCFRDTGKYDIHALSSGITSHLHTTEITLGSREY